MSEKKEFGNTLKDYLDQLEQEPTEVEKLAENLKPKEGVETPTEEKTAEEKVAEEELLQLVKLIDDRVAVKLAELSKQAVGVVGPTPDPQAVPENPAVQLPRKLGPEQESTNTSINQLINQLVAGGNAAGPGGYVATSGNIVAPATARGSEPPVAADAPLQAAANTPTKVAEEEVITTIYKRFFGGDE